MKSGTMFTAKMFPVFLRSRSSCWRKDALLREARVPGTPAYGIAAML